MLQEVSLHVPAGQVLGIVGSSGSGKSTLAKLIQRLYVPESGRVLIDGIDLSLADPAWLRRQIGVVLQENVLFNRIGAREHRPGRSRHGHGTGDRGGRARRRARLHPRPCRRATTRSSASAAPHCRAASASAIAIARALVGNPRILIFDEATSALDYESEAAIQANMRRICQNRTVILIAHRLSTLRHADRIVAIEAGRLVEDGTHEALLRAGGRYAQLGGCSRGDPEPLAAAAIGD